VKAYSEAVDHVRAVVMKQYVACLAVALAGCGQGSTNHPSANGTGAPVPAQTPPAGDEATPIVITQADEDAIRKLLEDFRAHTTRLEVSLSSSTGPYLDCPAHRALVGYGWKAVPYLIEQAGKRQSVDATLGAALIADPAVQTPEQVVAHNRARRVKALGNALPDFVLVTVLRETPAGKAAIPTTRGQGELDGIRHTDAFAWVGWWRANKGRFEFRTNRPPEIPLPEQGVYYWPHVTTTARGRLLDIHAVSATYRDIIERAAAELGPDVFIGKHDYLDLITTVRMKAVTFEEFLHLISTDILGGGLAYRKTATGYHIGGETAAPPRVNIYGWGIMMYRTVFNPGDEIPVTVITRGIDPLVSPDDPAFLGYGSFRVTRNDGSVVSDYRPVDAKPPTRPLFERAEDCTPVRVSLDRYCRLPAGEYNLRFRYRDHETPTVAIKIYDHAAKK
jgi:hypothetical protein